MYKTILSPAVLLTLTTMAVALPAQADDEGELVSLDTCLESAHAVHQGDFVKVEYLSVSPAGAPAYEIELQDANDTSWELMCNARTGDVFELETEVESADDQAFADRAKVSLDEAEQTATDRFGGTVSEVEYEIEANGSPTYEIDLEQPDQDNEFKVEIDAASGDIIETSVEQWQIGQEPEEEVDSAQSEYDES